MAFATLSACGDDTTEPNPAQPGFVLNVSIAGLTDTTFQEDSVFWRILSGPDHNGGVERQLTLEFIVTDPPAPLLSPLAFEVRWYHLQPALPAARSHALGLNPPADVVFEASSNIGTWAASQGQVMLTEVTDSSLGGSIVATLVPVFPAGSGLPNVSVQGTFWAPHVDDRWVGPVSGSP